MARGPLVALAVYSVVLLGWHYPPLYDLTLRNTYVHALEHLSFVGLGVLLWSRVFASPPSKVTLRYPARIAILACAMIPNVALSMVLAFSRSRSTPTTQRSRTAPAGYPRSQTSR